MNKLIYFIIIVAFLDTFVQFPIITPYAMDIGASYFMAGSIVAVYSFTNMLGNVVGGHWIDQFGRKKMLLISMIAVSIIVLFYPYAATSNQLFFIRLLHGLAGGILIPAAFAYVGDMAKGKTKGKMMAFTGACIGTAAIVGPAIGGIMAARISIESVFWLIAILFIVSATLIALFIKESFVSSERNKVKLSQFAPLLKHPLLMQASLAAFALMISNGTLAYAFPIKTEEIGLDSQFTGALLSVFGIVALIVFLTPLNRMYDKYKPISLVFVGLSLISIALIMLSFLTTTVSALLSMMVYGFGFAFIFPSMNKIVAESTTELDRGKAYGIFYAFFSLGVVAGSFIAGIVAEWLGYPFLISALFMIAVALVLAILSRRPVNETTA